MKPSALHDRWLASCRGAFCSLLLLLPLPAVAEDLEAILIHSDEPLWRPEREKVWPRRFEDRDSFGCIGRLKYGVWRFDRADRDREEDTFYRLTNYGVFHCFMNIGESYEPDRFDRIRPGFLVEIGSLGATELWAFQIGSVPGSDYMLLSRSPSKGVIDRFNVLQQRCPKDKLRGGPSMDLLVTRYCAVNSRRDLVAIAKRMAMLPALGTLTFERVAPAEEDDPTEEAP